MIARCNFDRDTIGTAVAAGVTTNDNTLDMIKEHTLDSFNSDGMVISKNRSYHIVIENSLIWRCPNEGYGMCGRFSEISLSNLCWIYNASWVSFKRELLYLNETFPGSYLLVIYPLTSKWYK